MNDAAENEKAEEELWREYRKTADPAIREKIVKQYAPLVKYVAGKVAIGMPQSVEFDDLMGYGVFGLLDAIEKFDIDKHVKFKTYAITRIRGAMFDELRLLDWVPRSIRRKAREVEQVVAKLETMYGRPATDEEIARELDVTTEHLDKLMVKISSTSLLSLNDVWNVGNHAQDKVAIIDNIESPQSMNPDIIVEKDDIQLTVVQSIKELPEKEKKILILYYYEELTLKEIGAVLGVTESRISQLHTKAIIRLRAKLANIKRGIL